MLLDTSYHDKKVIRTINEMVGLPFSLKTRWKMDGIGSKRMVIKDISDEYQKHLKASIYQTMANIELRPQGILIHFRDKLQTMTWVMPFSDFSMHYKEDLALNSNGKTIVFDRSSLDSKFIAKLNKIVSEITDK